MSKKEIEHTIHIKDGKETSVAVQCVECNGTIIFPNDPPICDMCEARTDKCRHGIACHECAKKLLPEWIREGNMKVDDVPQLKSIQKMLKKQGLEVFVNEKGYLEIEETFYLIFCAKCKQDTKIALTNKEKLKNFTYQCPHCNYKGEEVTEFKIVNKENYLEGYEAIEQEENDEKE